MILYQLRHGGINLLFHATGSPVINWHTVPQALLSAALALLAAEYVPLREWLEKHVLAPAAFFGPFAFLAGFIVVYRSQLAVQRYQTAQHNYALMASALMDLAVSIKCFCRGDSPAARRERATLFRWLRLYHKLSIGRFLGKSLADVARREGDNLCEPDEYDILLPTRHRSGLVMSWIQQAVLQFPEEFSAPPPLLARVFHLANLIKRYFNICANIAELPFPFPYLQIAVLITHVWCVGMPFIVGRYLPGSSVYAAFVAGVSTWILFSVNEAAAQMENPFDGNHNDLPMRYYEHVFATDLDALLYQQTPLALLPKVAETEEGEEESAEALQDIEEAASGRALALGEEAMEAAMQGAPSSSSSSSSSSGHSGNGDVEMAAAGVEVPGQQTNTYLDYTTFATNHLDSDKPTTLQRLFRFIGFPHKHLNTRDLLRDPHGNPTYLRKGGRISVAHIA